MRLLIVDDDEMTCLGIQKRIRDMAFRPITSIDIAFSAEEALTFARTWTVHILITDIRMCNMNGLDLVERLHEMNPHLHSIILTAYASFEYAKRAIFLGVDSFWLKPVSKEEMYDTLAKAVHKVSLEISDTALPDAGAPVAWAKDYVQQHMNTEVNMAQVANLLNLSYSYFSKLFKRQTGMHFSAYTLEVKMKEAGRLLLCGEKTTEIAEQLGYQSSQSFHRAFQNYWQCTPSEYKARHLQR